MNLEESKVLMNIESMKYNIATLPLVLNDLSTYLKKETLFWQHLVEDSHGDLFI
jgi:hypothetical protein